MNGTFESIAAFIVATGALGTAAFGIVEAFKWTSVGLAGFANQAIGGLVPPVYT